MDTRSLHSLTRSPTWPTSLRSSLPPLGSDQRDRLPLPSRLPFSDRLNVELHGYPKLKASTTLPTSPLSFLPPISGRLNIELHGYPKLNVYFVDLFHTLVNMPLKRFSVVLVAAYAALFITFAIPFLAFARVDGLDCLPGVKRLDHAVWFTVQSSMSIGFGGDLTPHPDCFVVNSFVAVLSVVTLGFAYALLGVFYVKFSRPTRRAGTIKFSQCMVMYEELGQLRLSFRVADFRKHQIIS
ncbi:unnamed protein product, partial [Closterium sp. NIES-65]